MKRITLSILAFSLLAISAARAQDFPMKRKLADRYYESFDYIRAIPMYEELVKEYPEDLVIFSRLADAYRKINDSRNAARCYAKLTEKDILDNLNLLYYAQALARTGNYTEAARAYERYGEAMPADSRGRAFAALYKNIQVLKKDSLVYRIDKSPLSTDASEFSPAYYRNKLVFASDRKGTSAIRTTYNWTESAFLDLYTGSPDGRAAELFSKELSTPYHEGPVTFSKNYDTIVFTRSNYTERQVGRSSDGINKLKLYIAFWDKDMKDWTGVSELPFNSDQYSTGHPALSPDGKSLYFASDMPGSIGETDLFVVKLLPGDGKSKSWGAPENLGRGVNSEGDEMFPFIDNEGNLWFASNGLPGLGGLDVFVARKKGNGFASPVNPGYKLNTRFDDFGYITRNSGKDGFLSSDRNNRYGNDDIYRVRRMTRNVILKIYDSESGAAIDGARISYGTGQGKPTEMITGGGIGEVALPSGQNYTFTASAGRYADTRIVLASDKLESTDTLRFAMNRNEAKIELSGKVVSASSRAPVPGAVAYVTDKSASSVIESRCNNEGVFTLDIKPGRIYSIKVKSGAGADACSSGITEISTEGITDDGVINREIPLFCLGDVIKVENIFYDLSKSDIRPEAARELDKVYEIMKSYPTMKIELRSHTDSRGSSASNLSLSEKRAASAAEYLYSKGIERDRIISKGYGESLLLNKCADGVKCSEEEHQVNRRTEFKVLSLE